MKKSKRISRELLDAINNVLTRFFDIELTIKNGEYQITKYYDNGYKLSHYPDINRELAYPNIHETDEMFTICEYAYRGGNYKVRLIKNCNDKGYGSVIVLVEDKDKVWDIETECFYKGAIPHTTMSIKPKHAIDEDGYFTVYGPTTFLRQIIYPNEVRGNLPDVEEITGMFYLLGELLLYTTFDGIYIKKYTKEGLEYFERCPEELNKSNLNSILESIILESNACHYIRSIAEENTGEKYTLAQVVELKNFLASRIEEFFANLKKYKKVYEKRYDEMHLKDDAASIDCQSSNSYYKSFIKSGRTRHFRN